MAFGLAGHGVRKPLTDQAATERSSRLHDLLISSNQVVCLRPLMNPGTLVLLTLSALTAHMLPAGDHVRELRIADQIRSYSVHIPPSYDFRRPAPIVLVFHSAMMNGAMMARFCGLSEKADRSGFVVVYANGTGSTPVFLYWDAGGVRGRVSDDVGYTAKLLDDLASVVNVDPKRVFATGMSNGGMMCYRLAAELSDRIAAIAPIAGTMAIENCRPERPVSIIHFHGTKDGLVLFGGPDERIPKNIKFLSVEETIRAWVKAQWLSRRLPWSLICRTSRTTVRVSGASGMVRARMARKSSLYNRRRWAYLARP